MIRWLSSFLPKQCGRRTAKYAKKLLISNDLMERTPESRSELLRLEFVASPD